MNLSTAEILRRLRESGLTREQVRQRLRQAGYDPTLADRYFDELARTDSAGRAPAGVRGLARPIPPASGDLLTALASIGLVPAERDTVELDSLVVRRSRSQPADRGTPDRRGSLARLPVFGRDLFSVATTEFQPVMSGPVDPDYELGPGDKLMLILTGDVELAYDLTVSREGYLVIPEVGMVQVAGLTINGLKQRLNGRLARVYSGIQSGATDFSINMGELRRKQVFLMGEVDIPGAYQVGGGATVFNALYQAGGPADHGTFRTIEVRRDNKPIHVVDLYDYLLRGDKSGDVRLEQGDIVFVPVADRRVAVSGNVRRPAIFELKSHESLGDVLRFAGGVQADAALERIQIDRILPAEQRRPGFERALVDVPLASLTSGNPILLSDGDRINVFAITEERRNRVTISGDVHRPALYEYHPDMTALDLIRKAQGLLSTAYTPAAHIVRLNPVDSTTQLLRVSLDDSAAANFVGKVRLADLDEVVIFGRARLINVEAVEVFGLVKEEGAYPFSSGMTVQDLVLLAGGFREGALERMAEVARRRPHTAFSDSLAEIYRVPIGLGLNGDPAGGVQDFALLPGDQVFIRGKPGFEPLKTVFITGQVMYPGSYTVESNEERVSRLVRRAGGLTPQAYARGFRLVREGNPVGIDLTRALESPGGVDDLIVRPGDTLSIPVHDPTVLITGAVAFQARVRYDKNLDLAEYLRRAGGTLSGSDEKRISVSYLNGEIRTTRTILGVKRYPRIEPGSVVRVPLRAETSGVDWDRLLTRSLSIVSSLATLMLAVRALQ